MSHHLKSWINFRATAGAFTDSPDGVFVIASAASIWPVPIVLAQGGTILGGWFKPYSNTAALAAGVDNAVTDARLGGALQVVAAAGNDGILEFLLELPRAGRYRIGVNYGFNAGATTEQFLRVYNRRTPPADPNTADMPAAPHGRVLTLGPTAASATQAPDIRGRLLNIDTTEWATHMGFVTTDILHPYLGFQFGGAATPVAGLLNSIFIEEVTDLTLLASDVVQVARDLHPSFQPETHPDDVLLRHLQMKARSIVHRIAHVDPRPLNPDVITVSLPLTTFADGIVLDPYLKLVAVEAVDTADSALHHEVRVMPFEHRNDAKPFPSCHLAGNTLYLSGTAADWTGYASIRLFLVPNPSVATPRITDVLAVPNTFLEVLALDLAVLMARRNASVETAGRRGQRPGSWMLLNQLIAQQSLVEEQEIDNLNLDSNITTFYTREVF